MMVFRSSPLDSTACLTCALTWSSEPKGSTKCGGIVVKFQHMHSAPHVGSVPALDLMTALRWARLLCRALGITLREGTARRRKREDGQVEGAKSRVKKWRDGAAPVHHQHTNHRTRPCARRWTRRTQRGPPPVLCRRRAHWRWFQTSLPVRRCDRCPSLGLWEAE